MGKPSVLNAYTLPIINLSVIKAEVKGCNMYL